MLGGNDYKAMFECEFIVVEVERNLFPMSLTGATIQDGGTRERRDAWPW